MGMGKKKRHTQSGDGGPDAPELNIMPFIDIFSMLNTFLLVSAAFIGFGILEVQIPFLSNSPDVKEAPARSFSIRIDIEEAQVKVTSLWTMPPEEKTENTYKFDKVEMEKFHQEMITLRTKVPENDKVTVYSDDNVKYENVTLVIDNVKTLKEKEPRLNLPPDENGKPNDSPFVFEKVVIGSVML